MPQLGAISSSRLSTCEHILQDIVRAAILRVDFSVVCGHRNKEEQDKAVAEGKSKTPWPTSKHNSLPSKAVDLAPWDAKLHKITWDDYAGYRELATVMFDEARKRGVTLRWGGDFNMDGDKTTNDAWDLPHFELKE